MSGFDPMALHGLGDLLDEDSAIVEVDADELRRITNAEVRRRCSGIKLAAQIIGIAAIESTEIDDAQVLQSMGAFMERLAVLRQAGLSVVGADKHAPEFPSVFNSVTSAMISAVTEEWKWSRIAPDKARKMRPALLAKLLEMAVKTAPERFRAPLGAVDLATVRRLSILDATPKIYSLTNYFDYYQADVDLLVSRLLRGVADQAEWHTELIMGSSQMDAELAERAILERMYGISVSLMREIYKAVATQDVQRLREMPSLDRSILLARYEHMGGMNYDHIIDKHRDAMDRTLDTANLIIEARQKPR